MNTPGHWKLKAQKNRWDIEIRVCADNLAGYVDFCIGSVVCPIGMTAAEAEANAEHIVLACNAHAELVAACKNAEYQLCRDAIPRQNNKSSSHRFLKTLDGLQTAIAKATPTC